MGLLQTLSHAAMGPAGLAMATRGRHVSTRWLAIPAKQSQAGVGSMASLVDAGLLAPGSFGWGDMFNKQKGFDGILPSRLLGLLGFPRPYPLRSPLPPPNPTTLSFFNPAPLTEMTMSWLYNPPLLK